MGRQIVAPFEQEAMGGIDAIALNVSVVQVGSLLIHPAIKIVNVIQLERTDDLWLVFEDPWHDRSEPVH